MEDLTVRKLALALCSVLLLVLTPATAGAARQLGASDSPSVSGPLTLTEESCENHHKRRSGRIVARSKSCLRIYRHANDNDGGRDHGALWLQVTVDAVDGWCATEAIAKTDVSATTSIGDSRTPKATTRPAGRREVRARVVVDGEGIAPTVGIIKQNFYLYPRVLRRSGVTETSDGRRLQLTWRGSSRQKLAFVLGAELSYPSNEPGVVTSDFDYNIIRSRSC